MGLVCPTLIVMEKIKPMQIDVYISRENLIFHELNGSGAWAWNLKGIVHD